MNDVVKEFRPCALGRDLCQIGAKRRSFASDLVTGFALQGGRVPEEIAAAHRVSLHGQQRGRVRLITDRWSTSFRRLKVLEEVANIGVLYRRRLEEQLIDLYRIRFRLSYPAGQFQCITDCLELRVEVDGRLGVD